MCIYIGYVGFEIVRCLDQERRYSAAYSRTLEANTESDSPGGRHVNEAPIDLFFLPSLFFCKTLRSFVFSFIILWKKSRDEWRTEIREKKLDWPACYVQRILDVHDQV